MRVTLTDIAREANVSPSTVSRVLNGYEHVSDETRNAVWRAAEHLGYAMDNLRALPALSQAVQLMGMGDDDYGQFQQDDTMIGTELARHVLIGAQAFLERHDIAVRMQEPRTGQAEKNVRRFVNDPGLIGFILIGGLIDLKLIRNLKAAQMPVVLAGGHSRELKVDCVIADYIGGMGQAVDHLVNTGRRKIGLLNGPAYTTSSVSKYKGFRLAMCLHDLPVATEQIRSSDFAPELGYSNTKELLDQAPDLDAVIYGDDFMAMGGLRAIKESGRRIPDDIAVIGFHDYQIAGFTDPGLTTVSIDMQLMGVMAARRLFMLLDEPDENPWFMLVQTALVVRESA